MQRVEPIELVLILVGADALTVRHVEVDHADLAESRREHASLRILEAVDLGRDVLGFGAPEQCNAVVGGLAAKGSAIAEGGEGIDGKVLVAELRLLEREDVGALAGEPVANLLETDT